MTGFPRFDRLDIHLHPSPLDLILASSAIFLSRVSLVVAILHGHTMESMAEANSQLVQANSWPFLQVLSSNQSGSAQEISFKLSNNGVGPAKISAVTIRYKGEEVRNWDKFLDGCCGRPGLPPLHYASAAIMPIVLRAGDSVRFLVVPKPTDDATAWDQLNVQRHQVSFEVCYCSVFDDCWKTNGTTLRLETVKMCPGSESSKPTRAAES